MKINSAEYPLDHRIGTYFSSIEPQLAATAGWPESDWSMKLLGWMVLLSIIPILPGLLWSAWHFYFVPHGAPEWDFGAAWVTTFSGLVVLGVIRQAWLGRSRARKKMERQQKLLDLAKFRFALCYGTAKEIDSFQISNLSHHAEKAREYWVKLWPLLRSHVNPFVSTSISLPQGVEVGDGQDKSTSWFPEVDFQRQSHSKWFKLEESTCSVLGAFNLLYPRITRRIVDKKDLRETRGAIYALARYFYCQIPQVLEQSMETDQGEIQAIGDEAFLAFTASVHALPTYTPDAPAPRKLTLKRLAEFYAELNASRFDGLLSKFFTWWLFFQAFTLVLWGGGVVLGFEKKLDSTLLTFVFGGPLVLAATATAAAAAQKPKEPSDRP